MRKLIITIVAFLLLAAAAGYWWSGQPLALKQPVIDLQVKQDGAQQISASAVQAGVDTPSWLLDLWLRIGGRMGNFKAGAYELKRGDTPRSFVNKLIKGEFAMRKVRIGEGWNIRQVRAALAARGAMDEGLAEGLVHLVDEVPATAIGHVHGARRGRQFDARLPAARGEGRG